MPGIDESQALELLGRARKVVRLREGEGERALSALRALRRAGFEAFELDLGGAARMEAAFSLSRKDPALLTGAGGAVTPEDVRRAARDGACWVTVPGPRPVLVEAGREEGILTLVRVREAGDVEGALELGVTCFLLAPPLSLLPEKAGLFASKLRKRGLLPALEGPWDAPLPSWASFHVITGGLFPRALLEEGRFREIESLARRAVEERIH